MIFGDAQSMPEIEDNSVHLVVTSPPYFNAPFDYPGLFESYDNFLTLIQNVAGEIKRVLAEGRIVALVIDDVLVDGRKYPLVADVTRIFVDAGFKYRERITWLKPEGYIRISRRSGVLIQNPYPMYYYPDNLQESILVFQNGEFDYKKVPSTVKQASKIDVKRYQAEKWFLNVWQITNVLPNNNTLEKGIASFPAEIPHRLITLFSYKGETVLDPFMGSGTTIKTAIALERQAIGYEIDLELIDAVKAKIGYEHLDLFSGDNVEIIVRNDARRLRSSLQARVAENRV